MTINPKIKKYLSIALLILLFVACLLGVWYFLFGNKNIEIPFLNNDDSDAESFFGVDLSGNDLFDPEYRQGNSASNLPSLDEKPPILRQLSKEPVAGYSFDQKEFTTVEIDETTTEKKTVKSNKNFFRFMEKATGHIYETVEDTLALTKINSETIPKIYKTTFLSEGDKLIFEQLSANTESIDSFWGELKKAGTSTEDTILKHEPLSIINKGFVSSPDGQKFVFQTNTNEGSGIFMGYSNKQKPVEIFSSPLKEFLIDWQNPNLISLNTKPSSGVLGYLFLLNTQNNTVKKIISGVPGLTSKLSPSGKYVLFAESKNNSISLFINEISTNTTKKLSISTLPEKCAFNPKDENIIYCGGPNWVSQGQYPDDWYKGRVSFVDYLWEIDQTSLSVNLFYSLEENGFDMFDVKMTKDGKFFTFINKNDLTLWSLDIERAKGSFVEEN